MPQIRILLIISLLFSILACIHTEEEFYDIDTSRDPIIELYSGEEITRIVDGYEFTIVPVAVYRASVRVICKKHYSSNEIDVLAPFDLCIVWGELAERSNLQYYACSQSDRGCFLRSLGVSPLDDSYVGSHLANIHIIPANETISRAIDAIRTYQKVTIEGFLVNVYSDGRWIWKTSVTWTDTGEGSCEVLYITKVEIGNAV